MNAINSTPVISADKLVASYVPVPKYENLIGTNTITSLTAGIFHFLGKSKESVISKVLKERFREMSRCSLGHFYRDFIPKDYFTTSYVFPNYSYTTVQHRLTTTAQMDLTLLEGRMLLQIDHFFTKAEGDELRNILVNGDHSVSYPTSAKSFAKGEKPPKSLGEENLRYLLTKPPSAVDAVHKLFSFVAAELNVDISTHPWHSSPSYPLANNFLTTYDANSASMGWHQDYDPKVDGTVFSLSRKLDDKTKYFDRYFVNGSPGNPWMLSLILYSTAENFKPQYGMGTKFNSLMAAKETIIACEHMRMALFEGDICHAIQEDLLPENVKTWRNTFVWRITLRPKGVGCGSIKEQFIKFITPLVKNIFKATPAPQLLFSGEGKGSFLDHLDESIE